jgi:hypothetical protein
MMEPEELKFGVSLTDEGIRFEIDSSSGFISQMSLLMDEEVIKHLQGQRPEIRLVLLSLDNDIQVKDLPVRIKSLAKHSSELHTIGGLEPSTCHTIQGGGWAIVNLAH